MATPKIAPLTVSIHYAYAASLFLFIVPTQLHRYDVVQFYRWFNFYFPLFFFMQICDNEHEI